MKLLATKIIMSSLALTALIHRVASAAGLEDAGSNLFETGSQSYGSSTATAQGAQGYLPALIGGIVQIALLVIGAVLLLLLVYGGYIWMIARGEADKVKKAKEIITNAIIGIIIVFAAYAISSFILTQVMSATGASQG